MDAKPRLLDRVRDRIRVKHYCYRTEQQYVAWIRRFVLFHGKRHPAGMGAAEVEAFLTHLATDRNVAASTQNQALSVSTAQIHTHVMQRGANAARSPLDV